MRTYIAVVTTGSFTEGAERLGISKALASKYVNQLEEHLGLRLLNRTTRQLNVTEIGQVYYQRCQQLIDELDELEDLVSKIDTKEEIVFRANHGSNAYNIKGTFPQNKDSMLEKISWMKTHPEVVRPKGLRGF